MQVKIKILLFLLLCSFANAAQVEYYIDPDAPGLNDGTSWTDAYTSMAAFDAGAQTDLVSAGNYITCYCRSLSGTDDTTAVVFDTGWTTGASNYIEFIGNDFPSDGIFDGTKYVLSVTNAKCVSIAQGIHIYFRKIQFESTATGSSNGYGISIESGIAGGLLHIDSCIFKGVSSTSGECIAMRFNDSSWSPVVYNTTVYGFINGSDIQHYGIWSDSVSTTYIYNCTIENCYRGVRHDSGAINVYNCAVFNNTDDFGGDDVFDVIDYCANDDDGDGTNRVDLNENASGEWTSSFTDYTTADFSVKDASAPIYDTGTADPSSGVYSDDIIDTARSTWDIGAFEYVAGASSSYSPSQAIIIN